MSSLIGAVCQGRFKELCGVSEDFEEFKEVPERQWNFARLQGSCESSKGFHVFGYLAFFMEILEGVGGGL